MRSALFVFAAATALAAAQPVAAAGPVSHLASGAARDAQSLVVEVGSRTPPRRHARDCTPYNGPHGYYGNPYCEGGFSRFGEAGKYEIDLTRYLDFVYPYEERRHRRYR